MISPLTESQNLVLAKTVSGRLRARAVSGIIGNVVPICLASSMLKWLVDTTPGLLSRFGREIAPEHVGR